MKLGWGGYANFQYPFCLVLFNLFFQISFNFFEKKIILKFFNYIKINIFYK